MAKSLIRETFQNKLDAFQMFDYGAGEGWSSVQLYALTRQLQRFDPNRHQSRKAGKADLVVF